MARSYESPYYQIKVSPVSLVEQQQLVRLMLLSFSLCSHKIATGCTLIALRLDRDGSYHLYSCGRLEFVLLRPVGCRSVNSAYCA